MSAPDYFEWVNRGGPCMWQWPDCQYQAQQLRPFDGPWMIGDNVVELDELAAEERTAAICDAVDVALASGKWSGFRFGERLLSNFEMHAFSIWREQSISGMIDRWAIQLLEWIGVTIDEHGDCEG